MDAGILHGLWTAAMIVVFAAIVVWAWSGRRRRDFEEAARLPLEGETDEGVTDPPTRGARDDLRRPRIGSADGPALAGSSRAERVRRTQRRVGSGVDEPAHAGGSRAGERGERARPKADPRTRGARHG